MIKTEDTCETASNESMFSQICKLAIKHQQALTNQHSYVTIARLARGPIVYLNDIKDMPKVRGIEGIGKNLLEKYYIDKPPATTVSAATSSPL